MTTIATLMTSNPMCLSEEDDVGRAIEVLVEGGFRHVPVVDDGRLVGIVSQTDVLDWLGSSLTELRAGTHASSAQVTTRFVGSVMVRSTIAVQPHTRVADAARLMLDHKIGSLPVVDANGRVVGIVTQTDVVRHVLSLELTEEQRFPIALVRPRNASS